MWHLQMKILFLSAYYCLPPATGSRIRTMEILKSLSAKHDVTYVAFADDERQLSSIEEARQMCSDVKVVFREHRYSKMKLLKGLMVRTPFTILNYHDPEMARIAQDMQQNADYDLIHAEGVFMAQYVDFSSARPYVLSTHNIESTIMNRFAETTPNPAKRLYARLTHEKLNRYESEIMQRFDRTLVVTEEEKLLATKMSPQAQVVVVPNGVDTEFFKPSPDIPEEANTLVFTGLMDSRSNVDGVLFFVREILPLIRREVADVKLRILGQRPAAEVMALAEEPGIEVTGFVPDVRPPAQSAAVHVVPLRVGGGSRLKILQALALEGAVVSTSVGAEGLNLKPNEHFILADDPAQFAKQTISLLRNPSRRAELGKIGRELVVKKYDWRTITAVLPPLYEHLVECKKDSAS